MQVALEQRTIESNLTGEEVKFQLDSDSPFIFELIRNKIYSDPIGSICREICDNARDAHREVGKQDTPIEIFMPGDFLTIKDFGPGLSEQRVKEIYTVYGRSSKRADNSQGGGFGIGAKTPFAYTDQFEIETVHNQMKYCWLSYLDESNIGKLKLISQQETLEKNYTAIRIPIKYNDRDKFIAKIIHYTKHYYLAGDATPHYIGQPQDIQKHTTISPTKTWAIFNKTREYRYEYNVILNGIPYEVCSIDLPPGCVLIFNVGDLDLSGTRETLQYTKKTEERLQAAKIVLETEIVEMLNKDCDSLPIEQFLDLIVKFQCKEQDWTYKGKTFRYPGKHFLKIRKNSRGSRLRDSYTTNPGRCPIYTYDTDSWEKVPQYIRQKIRKVLTQQHEIILCRPDHSLLTFFPHTDINTIKLNLYTKKDKDQIERDKELLLAYNIRQSRLIEIPYRTVEETIYAVTGTIRKNQTNFDAAYRYNLLPTFLISEASERKLHGNWIKYDDYIKRELWDKYTKEQLQELVDCQASCNWYSCIDFMMDTDPQFDFFKWKETYNLTKWQLKLIEDKYKGIVKEIDFTKYPLLKVIYIRSRYHTLNGDEQELILNYVRTCNATTPTV